LFERGTQHHFGGVKGSSTGKQRHNASGRKGGRGKKAPELIPATTDNGGGSSQGRSRNCLHPGEKVSLGKITGSGSASEKGGQTRRGKENKSLTEFRRTMCERANCPLVGGGRGWPKN